MSAAVPLAELYELRAQLAEELAAVDEEITTRQKAEEAASAQEPGDVWRVSRHPGRVRRGPQEEIHRVTCWSYPRSSAESVSTAEARKRLQDLRHWYASCPACKPDETLLTA